MTMKHITIPAEKKSLSKGIDPIIALLEDEEADFALITKIELAIDEILTNVALYAYAPDKGNIDMQTLLRTAEELTPDATAAIESYDPERSAAWLKEKAFI